MTDSNVSIDPLVGTGRLRASEQYAVLLNDGTWRDGGLLFDRRRWGCSDAEMTWSSSHHLVVLTETGGSSHTEIQTSGDPGYVGIDKPGVLSVVPAGIERRCAFRNADLIYSALWIDPTLHESLGLQVNSELWRPMLNGADVVITALMTALRDDMTNGIETSTSYMDHAAALVLLRLDALAGRQRPSMSRSLQPLSTSCMRRIDSYIDAHLAEDISLTALAGLFDVSVDTLARRFRATTGTPPYAYVLTRRVHRACLLLQTTKTPIADIALSLGFASQSHFSTTFRRAMGVTPHRFRLQFMP
ncbi:AraC family transcriptional regulator [Ferrovibrio sp.]|uniref:AraC family transcriptional regulator n=1 Tax=Ferrovibrio sp. TaxID=1917215 RepID=UPI00311FE745